MGGGRAPEASEEGGAMIDQKLLEVLVCPACQAKVRLDGDRLACRNPSCGLRYPIRDDIPIMLINEAEKPGQAAKGGS
jgi:uncharacterized protein YbaR (Trm112 family)